MDEARVHARLDRIESLDRGGARRVQLLAELRGLLREAEELSRDRRPAEHGAKEVVERLRTAPHGT